MANPNRGEVEFTAGDTVYKLAFTINSVCELEQHLGQSLAEIVGGMGRLNVIRAVLWAGLLKHHKMGIEEAGDVMDAAGVPATVEAVNKAVSLAFPPPEAGAARKNR